jgi:hypothetical protein
MVLYSPPLQSHFGARGIGGGAIGPCVKLLRTTSTQGRTACRTAMLGGEPRDQAIRLMASISSPAEDDTACAERGSKTVEPRTRDCNLIACRGF